MKSIAARMKGTIGRIFNRHVETVVTTHSADSSNNSRVTALVKYLRQELNKSLMPQAPPTWLRRWRIIAALAQRLLANTSILLKAMTIGMRTGRLQYNCLRILGGIGETTHFVAVQESIRQDKISKKKAIADSKCDHYDTVAKKMAFVRHGNAYGKFRKCTMCLMRWKEIDAEWVEWPAGSSESSSRSQPPSSAATIAGPPTSSTSKSTKSGAKILEETTSTRVKQEVEAVMMRQAFNPTVGAQHSGAALPVPTVPSSVGDMSDIEIDTEDWFRATSEDEADEQEAREWIHNDIRSARNWP